MLPEFPDPLVVTCDSCGKSARTFNGTDPDSALECGCCPLPHSHAGLGCRTVTIRATARLTLFDAGDLLDAAATAGTPSPAGDMAERQAPR